MSTEKGKILVIDDDIDVQLSARLILKKNYEEIQTENDPFKIKQILANNCYDVVLLDMNYSRGVTSGKEGLTYLKKILALNPDTSVVMMTAYGDVDLAVEAMKLGAADFVVKPWENNKKLLEVVEKAYEKSQACSKGEKSVPVKSSEPLAETSVDMIGESPAMQEVIATINKVAGTDVNVLILGENGTGKEVVARAIHTASLRSGNDFVGVDLGAIPATLFESELFGHKKGAFTDAKEDRAGKFEIANEGTLFLDEIGNLSLPLQVKLLSALQNRTVTRVGANDLIPTDIRLVCATNMPLYEMVEDNRFRQDLLYRINTVEIHLPPLRKRQEDIPLLMEHYLNLYANKYNKEGLHFTDETIEKFKTYSWPGNVRELQHVVERGVIMSEAERLEPNDFVLHHARTTEESTESKAVNLEDIEKEAIKNAILKYNGNLTKAAMELGLGRTTLYRKMAKYDI